MVELNKYGNGFDGKIIPIYAVRHGDKEPVAIEKMSYSVVRAPAPIYSMGTRNPRSFERGKRGVAGTFVIHPSDLAYLGDGGFDIRALIEEKEIQIRLENVEIISMHENPDTYMMDCTFICQYIKADNIPKRVQQVTNREMASKVLELS